MSRPAVTSSAIASSLIVMYYAAAHPRWKPGPETAGLGNPTPADGQLHIAEPRPAAQVRDSADHDATPEKARQARGLNRVAWL
jgi:hypothetical protein